MGARMGSVTNLLNVNVLMGGKETYVILRKILVRIRNLSLNSINLSNHINSFNGINNKLIYDGNYSIILSFI